MSNAMVVRSSADTFVGMQNTASTRKSYKWAVDKWFDWLGDRPVDVDAAIEYRGWLEQTMKVRSANHAYSTIRLLYRFLKMPNSPFETVKGPKRVSNATPVVPPDTIVDGIVDLCDNARERLVLYLLLNGLRASEVGGLRRSDIMWSPEYGRDIIRVIGKGSKERLVPASMNVSRALRRWDCERQETEFLFGEERMSLRAVQYVVEKWSARAGDEFRPHKLRHHYATRMARNGVNPFVLKDLLGHENIATTMIYVRMNLADAVAEAGKDPMDYVKAEVSNG